MRIAILLLATLLAAGCREVGPDFRWDIVENAGRAPALGQGGGADGM